MSLRGPFRVIAPGQRSVFQKNIPVVSSRWQHCVQFDPQYLNLRPPALETKALPLDQLTYFAKATW